MKFCGLLLVLLASLLPAQTQTGALTIHMILHAVGEERYEIKQTAQGVTLNTTMEYTDRANKRTMSATLQMQRDYTPLQFAIAGRPESVSVQNASATVQENGASRTFAPPTRYFTIFGLSPFAVQMMLLRYWNSHGRPAELPMLRAAEGAEPIHIVAAGQDSIAVDGKHVKLHRYTIANLAFGREVVWTNAQGDLAAAMTFAGGLPMEAVRTEYEAALPHLYRSGVAQQMLDFKAISLQVPSEVSGTFAISGATLIDGTGASPVLDSVVLIRNSRIGAAGARATVPVPRGVRVIDGTGKTLLPGLWEMHIHASGVEFGPALLAAGITTARDCGGEFDYLVAQRQAIDKSNAPGPRMLLAGLVDAGGIKAFGHVTAETPDQGRAVVDRYHAAGFEQMKLYTYLQPEVIKAIAEEAHRLGMTVTGHVPQAVNTFEGIQDGMDQINHLNYISNMLRPPGAQETPRAPVDVNSDAARKAIEFLKQHHTVVDPTAGWGEMASHSKEVDVASFEPGIAHAPFVLNAKFRGMGGTATAEQMKARMAQTLAVIGALHQAGIPIVPGSDTGLPGYGLLRELELYVQAGFTPLEAIQSATIVSARAMQLDRDSGTVEPGKRADLILVDGDPLANISDLRKVSRVVTNGRMYDTAKLWRSVGFHP